MVILVAVSFFVCWTPFYVVSLVSQLEPEPSFLQRSQFLFTMLSCHWTGFLNSCINPLIYCSMSARFRRSFHKMLSCICICFGCRARMRRRQRRRHFECQMMQPTGNGMAERGQGGGGRYRGVGGEARGSGGVGRGLVLTLSSNYRQRLRVVNFSSGLS